MINQSFRYKNRRKPTIREQAPKVLGLVFCALTLIIVGVLLVTEYNKPIVVEEEETVPIARSEASQAHEPEVTPQPEIVGPKDKVIHYDEGKIIVTTERKEYSEGDMTLRIPKLDIDTEIYDGVDDETLKKGVGLFDYAMLPGPLEQNSNVSLAGHRDVYGEEFYYLDQLEEGDQIFLIYRGKEYTYEVEHSFETHPNDWTPIEVKEYACVTLQTCTPIGVASHRLFVVGRLVAVAEIEQDQSLPPPASSEEESQSGQDQQPVQTLDVVVREKLPDSQENNLSGNRDQEVSTIETEVNSDVSQKEGIGTI